MSLEQRPSPSPFYTQVFTTNHLSTHTGIHHHCTHACVFSVYIINTNQNLMLSHIFSIILHYTVSESFMKGTGDRHTHGRSQTKFEGAFWISGFSLNMGVLCAFHRLFQCQPIPFGGCLNPKNNPMSSTQYPDTNAYASERRTTTISQCDVLQYCNPSG